MPAVASSKIKTRIVHQPQKNGVIYVLEHRTLYEPVKKYNKILFTRVISKSQKEKIPLFLPAQSGSMQKKFQIQSLPLLQ